jgi:putative transcriptional regulator
MSNKGVTMAEKKLVRISGPLTPERRAEIMGRVDWAKVDAMTEEDIERNIASDPDASPITEAEGVALRVQHVRKRTGLSQAQFAGRFGIPVGTLRDWEQARSTPDATALSYLRVIERDPQAVIRALEPDTA